MNNYNLEIHLNKFNESDPICSSISKINKILGHDFELTIDANSKLDIVDTNSYGKILNFKFINKSELKNSEKSEYVNKKIEMLKINNFIEVEEKKISGVGRFIKICLKSIKDYEDDKILLLKEFMEKINIIDEKINLLK
jgi:hypothetical protein